MAYCANCGAEVAKGQRYCANCGQAMGDSAPARASVPQKELATPGQCLLAWLIDGVVGSGISLVAVVPVSVVGGPDANGLAVFAGFLWLLLVLAVALLFWLRLWRRGLSPGKAVMGIQFVKYDYTEPGLGTALLREVVGKWVSSFVFYLGYIWILFDRYDQGWHDKIAGTYVVRR